LVLDVHQDLHKLLPRVVTQEQQLLLLPVDCDDVDDRVLARQDVDVLNLLQSYWRSHRHEEALKLVLELLLLLLLLGGDVALGHVRGTALQDTSYLLFILIYVPF
jgi:hypothetical protein